MAKRAGRDKCAREKQEPGKGEQLREKILSFKLDEGETYD
jgi:hypothetical protein